MPSDNPMMRVIGDAHDDSVPIWYRAVAAFLFIGGVTVPLVPVFATWGYYEGRKRGFRAGTSTDSLRGNFARQLAGWSVLAFGPMLSFILLSSYDPMFGQIALALALIWVPLGIYASPRLCSTCYRHGY